MESDCNVCDNMYDGLHVRVSVYIKTLPVYKYWNNEINDIKLRENSTIDSSDWELLGASVLCVLSQRSYLIAWKWQQLQ